MGGRSLFILALLVTLVPGLTTYPAAAQMEPLSVRIVSPMDGATVAGPDVTFMFLVTGITLAPDEIGGANVPGHGHMHIYLDGMFKGTVGTAMFTLMGLAPGMHTVRVDLHQNNHALLMPTVEASVTFIVA
ncbi:MAG: Ig-like domain-containing protein [Chloroflexi bacterium]|nr:Ig-like domain-containing protein [Chloroflexota bacterium]